MALSIGAAAQRTGMSADTLRYYERIGLLPPPARSAGGQRVYRQRDLERLRFIRQAQAVGFSLEEIGQLLRFREDPAGSRQEVRELAVYKHQWVRERLETLEKMEGELALLLAMCSGAEQGCPILEHLEGRQARLRSASA